MNIRVNTVISRYGQASPLAETSLISSQVSVSPGAHVWWQVIDPMRRGRFTITVVGAVSLLGIAEHPQKRATSQYAERGAQIQQHYAKLPTSILWVRRRSPDARLSHEPPGLRSDPNLLLQSAGRSRTRSRKEKPQEEKEPEKLKS